MDGDRNKISVWKAWAKYQ